MKNLLRTLANRDEEQGALGRHSAMLASLILLLTALPLGHAITGGHVRFPVLLALVLTTAVIVNSHQRWIFLVTLVIGVGAISGTAYSAYTGSEFVRIASDISSLALLGLTTLVMFNSLLSAEHVSQDTVIGGICVYLLIGLCFALSFILITDLSPGALMQDGAPLVRSAADPSAHATTCLYFSFVTLTTLGYGDITPVGDVAHMFAVAEAVIGQLYLAIFVARLIALYVVGIRRRE
jgi:voltage-gated potassium channel